MTLISLIETKGVYLTGSGPTSLGFCKKQAWSLHEWKIPLSQQLVTMADVVVGHVSLVILLGNIAFGTALPTGPMGIVEECVLKMPANYSKLNPPVLKQPDNTVLPVKVYLDHKITRITEINDKTRTIAFESVLHTSWEDHSLLVIGMVWLIFFRNWFLFDC